MMRRQAWVSFALAVLAAAPVLAQSHTVTAGDDGWVTPGGGLTKVNLSGWNLSSVFPGGSITGDPVVNLKGKPIKPAMGSIDTVVRHTGTHTYTAFNQTKTIPVQIVGLSLVSDSDSVTISGWGTYGLEIYLSTAAAGTGSMAVKQVNGHGGTFDSSFSVVPVAVFVNVANPSDRVRLDCGAAPSGTCGAITLISTSTGWVHTISGSGGFNPAAAGVTPLASGIAFDANGDGTNDTTTIGRNNTFIPGYAAAPPFPVAAGTHEHADYSARHITKPPQDCLRSTQTANNTRNGSAVDLPVEDSDVLCEAQAEPIDPSPVDPSPADPSPHQPGTPVGGLH